ncbi:MAG: hypothetical protein M0D53_05095 [Flavobacterium sp. JAD_PAG50586_2]|nr:MAG: hypothetical protein M0D53_05095 [Flavobacterium sp. JAD_PAG50586_2]
MSYYEENNPNISFCFYAFCCSYLFICTRKKNNPDAQLKETFYKKYKKEVQAYDKKDFDTLFLDFFKKQRDASLTLTQEEFYTYTIKIAIYSEKLGLLYKDQKDESQRAKQEWFDKNYSDYLNSKK